MAAPTRTRAQDQMLGLKRPIDVNTVENENNFNLPAAFFKIHLTMQQATPQPIKPY
jgi:hypothetical protein